MRQYQPIWEQIKKHGTATVVASKARHRRIIQAVRKEKWRDAAFRLLASEQNKHIHLFEIVDTEKGIITFVLKEVERISIRNL